MKIKWKTEWHNDLIWCPSQLTRDFTCPIDNITKTLYCRWRHDDPWTFKIIQKLNWVSLGSGLTQETEIETVHQLAIEKLEDYYSLKL